MSSLIFCHPDPPPVFRTIYSPQRLLGSLLDQQHDHFGSTFVYPSLFSPLSPSGFGMLPSQLAGSVRNWRIDYELDMNSTRKLAIMAECFGSCQTSKLPVCSTMQIVRERRLKISHVRFSPDTGSNYKSKLNQLCYPSRARASGLIFN